MLAPANCPPTSHGRGNHPCGMLTQIYLLMTAHFLEGRRRSTGRLCIAPDILRMEERKKDSPGRAGRTPGCLALVAYPVPALGERLAYRAERCTVQQALRGGTGSREYGPMLRMVMGQRQRQCGRSDVCLLCCHFQHMHHWCGQLDSEGQQAQCHTDAATQVMTYPGPRGERWRRADYVGWAHVVHLP